ELLPKIIQREDITFQTSFVDSRKHLRLQVCDILMGAAGSFGNRMDKRRSVDQRKMSVNQACRLKLAKTIQDHFTELSQKSRGSKAFNWFESTGIDGDRSNNFRHKVRIWKLIPGRYRLDDGWLRSHLGPGEMYSGERIGSKIHTLRPEF